MQTFESNYILLHGIQRCKGVHAMHACSREYASIMMSLMEWGCVSYVFGFHLHKKKEARKTNLVKILGTSTTWVS